MSLAAQIAHDENRVTSEINYLEKLLNIDSRNWKVKRRLALALFDGKRFKECSRYLEDVLDRKFDDTEVHFKLGICLEKSENIKAAKNEYLWVTENDPFHLEARVALAELYNKSEDNKSAVEEYVRLVEQNPENKELLWNLGETAKKAGEEEIAITAFSELVKANPKRYEVHLPLAEMKLNQNHFQRAFEHIERFLEWENDNIEALLLKAEILKQRGQFSQALELCFHVHAIAPETKGLLLKIGKLHQANGQIEQALTCFKDHLNEDPFDIDTIIILAEADEEKRLFSDAIQKYRKALKVSSDDVRAPMALARLYSSLDDYREAIRFTEMASNITGQCYELSIFKAQLYLKINSTEKAKEELIEAVSIMDDLPEAHRLLGSIYAIEKSHTRVLYHLNKLPLSYSDDADYCKELGTSYLALGHTEKARQWLEAAHKNDHQSIDVLISLGDLELAEKDYGRAMGFGRTITSLDETIGHGFRITGLALYGRKAYSESEELLRKALVTMPSNDSVREILAQVRYNLGNFQSAIDLYPELALLPTSSPEKRLLKSKCYFAQGNMVKALEGAELALKDCPYDTEALSLQGSVYKEQLNYAKAETALNKAIKSNPALYTLYRERGEILLLKNNVDRGRMDLLKALEGENSDTKTLILLGKLELKDGRVRKALEYLNKVTTIKPTSAEAHYLRAQAYEAMEDSESALESLENVAHLDPSNEECLMKLGKKHLFNGNREKSQEYLEKYLAVSDERLPALTALAEIHEESGNISEARFYLREILRTEQGGREIYIKLSELLFSEERTDEAWDLLNESKRNYPGLYGELGHRLLSRIELSEDNDSNRHKLAEDLFKKAVNLNKSDFESLLSLAKVYYIEKDCARAKDTLNKLLSTYPDFARAHYQMALINIFEERKDEALESLRMCVTCDDKHSDGWMKLAKLQLENGQFSEAIEAANGAISANAEKIEAIRILAKAFEKAGKIAEATECYIEISEADPNENEILSLATGFEQTGKPEKALATLRKWSKENETVSDELKLILGRLLFEAKEFNEAITYLELGLKLNDVKICRSYLAALMEMGKVRKAAIAVKKLLEISKNDRHGLLAAGKLSMNAKNYNGAEKAYNLVVSHHRNCIEAEVELSKIYLIQGRVREALKAVRKVVKEAPNHLPSLSLMAELYERLQMYEKAKLTLEKIITLPQGNKAEYKLNLSKMYRKSGELKMAEDILTSLEGDVEAGSMALREKINLTFSSGEYRNTLDLYSNYRKRFAEEPEMPELAGICFAKLGMSMKAAAQLQHMMARKLPLSKLTCELARQYKKEGRQLDGERLISKSLESDPSSVTLWMTLADLQLKRRAYNEAEQSITNLLVFKPEDKDGQLLLGYIYEQSKQYEKMGRTFLKLSEDNPYMAKAHLGLGKAELLKNLPEKAKESFKKSLAIDKSCAEAHMGYADALRQTGDRDGAIKAYREVLKVDGRNTKALYELGTTYKMVQKRELAIFHLEKLLETAPADSHYAGLARKLLNQNRGMLIN